jgi:uncharacterized protein YqgC (DUF456 family)
MDLVFIISGLILMFIGIIGSILPILPGVPISWLGLLMLYFAPSLPFDSFFITVTGIVALTLYVLDYIIPALGAKKFGGSRAGMLGTTIGLMVGIIAPIPFGILIGPFAGAFIGETVFNKTEGPAAFKAAIGSFIGFLSSTFIKFIATVIYFGLFVYKLMSNWDVLLTS